MPMNKVEKAEMLALRERAALGWPPFAEPAPMPRAGHEMQLGWRFNPYSCEVGAGARDSLYGLHGLEATIEDAARKYKARAASLSRNEGMTFYATKLDALRALRWAKAREYAKVLAKIDGRIAEEPV